MFEGLTLVLVFAVVMTAGIRTLAHLQNLRRHGHDCTPCRILRALPGVAGTPRAKG